MLYKKRGVNALLKDYLNAEDVRTVVCLEYQVAVSFMMPVTYRLLLVNDSQYFCEKCREGQSLVFSLDNSKAARCWDSIKNAMIVEDPPDMIYGLDGIGYNLKIFRGNSPVEISWWDKGPGSWRVLIGEVRRLFALSRRDRSRPVPTARN